jgi:hypothetical protein
MKVEIEKHKPVALSAESEMIDAHKFLVEFIAKFDTAKRGGIHDFMELTIFNMINFAIKSVDDYLQTGHKQVSANEIMTIVVDSYQKILDGMKKNLEGLKQVNFH